MSRSEHHRTPLHHAAAKNFPQIVQLLSDLGADANGTMALSATSREHADPTIVTMLQAAGAKLDFMSALYLERYETAESMLKDDSSRLGPEGSDTIVLHLSVSQKKAAAVPG